MDINTLQYITVKVGNGSGCLFQPLDGSYTYVLTAKHNVEGNPDLEIVRQVVGNTGIVENLALQILEAPYLHNDPDKDAAIIKIGKVDDFVMLLRAEVDFQDRAGYYLCGHPESRQANSFSYRYDELKINNRVEHNYIEGEINRNVSQEEISGQSGGGIIRVEETCLLLAGIQSEMAVKDVLESLSRVKFAPLSFFDEIIVDNSDSLSPLFPPYFSSLEVILDEIFPLPGLMLAAAKEQLIKEQLKVIARNLCDVFSAQQVLDLYKESILAHGTQKSYVTHKQLWIAFLELLAINQISVLDKDLTWEDLSEIRKRHNLIFLDCDDWVKKLDLIVMSDLSNLEKGGAIIVSSTKDLRPTTVELDIDYINDICAVPSEKMIISTSVTNLAEDIRIVHIYKFQKHIIENYAAFKGINSANVKTTVRNETQNII